MPITTMFSPSEVFWTNAISPGFALINRANRAFSSDCSAASKSGPPCSRASTYCWSACAAGTLSGCIAAELR